MAESAEGFWENPCGFEDGSDESDFDYAYDIVEYIENAAKAANVANKLAEEFRELLRNKYPSIDVDSVDEFDFLTIPDINEDKLDSQEVLKDGFSLIQRYAVALEQMIEDGMEEEEDFLELLQENKEGMIQLLCQLQILLRLLQLEDRNGVTRDIMPDHLKNLSISQKAIRNLRIVKGYINATIFVRDILSILSQR